MNQPARGIRNNNPGNIDRNGIAWQGMCSDQSGDSRFIVFDSPLYGIRALAKVLLTYYRTHGLCTPAAIIGRWAPAVENNTEAYAFAVASALGVSPETVIDATDPATLQQLVRAIIKHENGQQPYDAGTIRAAVALALK
jgi:hypothetical protein